MRGQDPARRMTMRHRLAALAALVLLVTGTAALAQMASELTGHPPPTEHGPADPRPRWVVDDRRVMRACPRPPPVIPHANEGYELSVNANRCLSCHKREFTESSGAPMISVTHYMDRAGQMLADVSPRRYFCTACHVPQADARPLVDNLFRDMSELGIDHAGDR